jgi:hypothetical protein
MSPRKQPVEETPEPDALTLEGDWEDVIGQVIRTPKPKGGWPKPGTKLQSDSPSGEGEQKPD